MQADQEKFALTLDIFPSLRALTVTNCRANTRHLTNWFDPAVDRPIQHLRLTSSWRMTWLIQKLAGIDPRMLERLRFLDIDGADDRWWVRGPEILDESDVENASNNTKTEEKADTAAEALRLLILSLPNFQELSLDMESSTIY